MFFVVLRLLCKLYLNFINVAQNTCIIMEFQVDAQSKFHQSASLCCDIQFGDVIGCIRIQALQIQSILRQGEGKPVMVVYKEASVFFLGED